MIIEKKLKMIDQLKHYQSQLENLSETLEDRYPESEAAQERMDERLGVLEECIDQFGDLIDLLEEYQENYKGLAKF